MTTHPLRFGLGTGNRKPFPELVRNWQMIENMGFDTAWVVDHFMSGNDEDIPYMEAWTLITALGMMTNRLRFGILVSCNTFRNPGLLAKQAVTTDHASNGRVELGIGAGWMEREHEAYGIDLMPVGERVSMFEESLQVIRSLMTRRRTDFDGTYYRFIDAPFEPKPVQERGIPIVVGAFGRRTISIAGRHADNWNTRAEPDEAATQIGWMRAAAEKAGRDPNDIRCSVFTWEHPFTSEKRFRDVVMTYREIGFTDFQFPMPPREDWAMMEQCARNVMPELRRMT
jgi:alkanesulfonate monooxygenase SsuD/methylene tetrahydromethanopterin reductase-like flavin-dependent oxidoreductase (luciferase family)